VRKLLSASVRLSVAVAVTLDAARAFASERRERSSIAPRGTRPRFSPRHPEDEAREPSKAPRVRSSQRTSRSWLREGRGKALTRLKGPPLFQVLRQARTSVCSHARKRNSLRVGWAGTSQWMGVSCKRLREAHAARHRASRGELSLRSGADQRTLPRDQRPQLEGRQGLDRVLRSLPSDHNRRR
jgi:hypothetical protein